MNLTQEDWIAQYESDENAVILDVRTAMEFNEGFIAGAINYDFHQGAGFIADLETLDKYFRTVLSSKKHQIPSLKTTKDLILEHLGSRYQMAVATAFCRPWC